MDLANSLAMTCQLPSHTHPPYPPGFAFANPFAGASGFANANPPTPNPPAMAGLRWDRWNQRLDGTQFGPPGGALWGRCDLGRVTRVRGRTAVEYGEFSDRLEAARLVLGRESLRT
jgi:hypothetical protein